MMEVLYVMNAGAVGLYGSFLSIAFCDIKWTKQKCMILWGTIAMMAAWQAMFFATFGGAWVRWWYPVITHLPLVILLGYLTRKWAWSVIAVLTAYLCCHMRRWIALFCIAIFSGNENMQNAVELAITLPLLFLMLRFAAPAVKGMSHYPVMMQVHFGVIPAVSYLFDYLTRVYTNWLVEGVPAAVEFMPFVCAVAYLFFALRSAETLRRQSELEQLQAVLDLQVKQSFQQIDSMKKSQEQAAAYRHDLRHHLQYLSSCIEHNALGQAQDYISSLNQEITTQAVTQYCENTAINFVLSVYVGRAAEAGIPMSVHVRLGELSRISDNDLCVLFSNALENALNACVNMKAKGKDTMIEVQCYKKTDRVLLEIVNSCSSNIVFQNGIPISRKKGHGIGVRSICAVVEKYGGIYSFEVKDGHFVLRLSI